ncbi:MAG: four helix bundle protein [Armatimonadetes bacterium]|nr:four helix bundle protein [Armatimonadota bacterium]
MRRSYELPPAYTKAYDLCVWLLGRTAKFAAQYRTCLAAKIDEAAVELVLTLRRAAETKECEPHLRRADELVADLRVLLRIAYGVKAFRGSKSYRYAASGMDEIGRMIGGWLKQTATRKPRSAQVSDRAAVPTEGLTAET